MNLVLLLVALLLGAALSAQVGVNAQLRTALGHPLLAATMSFLIGSLALIVGTLVARPALPAAGQLARIPWWQWSGGLLGALYIVSAIVLAPRLGAAALLAAIVAGQMVASLLLDHFGWLGFPVQPITLTRIVAVLLIISGVLLLQSTRA